MRLKRRRGARARSRRRRTAPSRRRATPSASGVESSGEGGAAPRLAVPVGGLGAVRRRARASPSRGASGRSRVLSSFPPTASHVAALALHRADRLPWIADFRDPWTWGADHGYVWARDRRERGRDRGARCCAARLRSRRSARRSAPSWRERARRERRRAAARHSRRARRRGRAARPFERLELVHAGTRRAWSADLTPVVRALLRLHETGHAGAADAPRPGRVPPAGARPRRGSSGSCDVQATSRARRRSASAAAADVALLVQKRPVDDLGDDEALGLPRVAHADPRRGEPASATPRRSCARRAAAGRCRTTRTQSSRALVARRTSDVARGESLWMPDEEALARYDAKAISRRFIELLLALR